MNTLIIPRTIEEKTLYYAKKFPIVALLGPRQSGKTTLAKALFPNKPYVSLEDPHYRLLAQTDPRSFLLEYKGGAIFDEIQRAPEVLSYLQTMVDEDPAPGRFILTGSHHLLLLEHITQSLAGRVALLKLLPLSLAELQAAHQLPASKEHCILFGGYPRIYHEQLRPNEWYPFYIESYVERDVRLIKNITNLTTFLQFLRSCASRVGQQLNYSSLGNEVGITHNTARAWISLLEASYILYRLPVYHKRLSTQATKMPKLYFYDSGVACSLLGIETVAQLQKHSLFGALFENLIQTEILKAFVHHGRRPPLAYWRDQSGREVDGVIDAGGILTLVEIKLGQTVQSDWFNSINYLQDILKQPNKSVIIYGGNDTHPRSNTTIASWREVEHYFEAEPQH